MRRRMVIEKAERLHRMPPFPAAELARYKQRLAARGVGHIDLTVGKIEGTRRDPVLACMTAAIEEIGVSGQDLPDASQQFCEAFARWFVHRFDVELDPATQILPLVNTKIGASCLSLALVNPGETVLVPDPAYPAYRSGAIMAGGRVHALPLLERNDYLPNLLQVDPVVAGEAKLMFLSYPNNPTGAVADLSFFRNVVDFARRHNIIVCHDATHALLAYDDYETPSLLQAPGGIDAGVELFSLSIVLGGHPWDIGVAVGNSAVLSALSQLTQHVESASFLAVQRAAAAALEEPNLNFSIEETISRYMQRRDTLVDNLQQVGWKPRKPKGGVYAWISVPPRYSSVRFCVLLRKAGVFVVPGSYMGEYGEGYVRLSLNAPEVEFRAVADRMEKMENRLRLRRRIIQPSPV